MDWLEKALEIALHAHSGVKDKAGHPYILHVLRVMHAVEGLTAKTVALLHDVLEDSSITLSDLEHKGFPKEILTAVDHLTRRPDEKYSQYIKRLSQNPLARMVKIADLKDNLDASRLKRVEEVDQQRLNKYLEALKFLTQNAK